MSAGRIFVAVWQFDALYDVNKALEKTFPGARYKVIEPMSATGERTTMKDFINRGWTTTFIPREAKHPEEALNFMRYMFSYEHRTVPFLKVKCMIPSASTVTLSTIAFHSVGVN